MTPQNIVFAILALVFLLSIKPLEASRALYKERIKIKNLLLQSLNHFPTPPSRPSGGSHIPASSTTINTINEKGFAGHTMPHSPVNPQLTVSFGVAKN
ncbi:hypothetical protein LOK49_LG15G00607 [Camellia lanceoleosa]|uniref:Uncharacterized protein n=1 Tax=Camellia lanceoleosa TaxID=1840588 RepID=A0ACC0F3P9_9ERIC|nr:hypothetical protein LOK49_LG15G00607 [Camellia lanceoleosa]